VSLEWGGKGLLLLMLKKAQPIGQVERKGADALSAEEEEGRLSITLKKKQASREKGGKSSQRFYVGDRTERGDCPLALGDARPFTT